MDAQKPRQAIIQKTTGNRQLLDFSLESKSRVHIVECLRGRAVSELQQS